MRSTDSLKMSGALKLLSWPLNFVLSSFYMRWFPSESEMILREGFSLSKLVTFCLCRRDLNGDCVTAIFFVIF